MANTSKYRTEKTLANMNLRNRRCCLNSSCDGVSEIRSRMDVSRWRRIALSPIDRRQLNRCQCIEPFFRRLSRPVTRCTTNYHALRIARANLKHVLAAKRESTSAMQRGAVQCTTAAIGRAGADGDDERMLPTQRRCGAVGTW